MPPGKPRVFHWFFGLWAAFVLVGVLVPGMRIGGAAPGDTVVFWLWLIGSTIGCAVLWPIVVRGQSESVWFRPVAGAEPKRLRPPGAGGLVIFFALVCTVGTGFTLGTLPFSGTTQYLAGLRGRVIALPQSPFATEDLRPADIYLLPLRQFPPGAAARLAEELRRETGLVIAALPPAEVANAEYDPRRKQIVAESLLPEIAARGSRLPLPPPPRSHGPLIIGLLEDDAYSRVNEWRFILSLPFNQTTGVISTNRLSMDLPLDDAEAQELLARRTRKLILRMIAFHCFNEPRGNDPRSLTGPTLRGVADLDQREDHLRIRLPSATVVR